MKSKNTRFCVYTSHSLIIQTKNTLKIEDHVYFLLISAMI